MAKSNGMSYRQSTSTSAETNESDWTTRYLNLGGKTIKYIGKAPTLFATIQNSREKSDANVHTINGDSSGITCVDKRMRRPTDPPSAFGNRSKPNRVQGRVTFVPEKPCRKNFTSAIAAIQKSNIQHASEPLLEQDANYDQQEKPKDHMDTIIEQEENSEQDGWGVKEKTLFHPDKIDKTKTTERHMTQTPAHTTETPVDAVQTSSQGLTCADYEQLSELLGKVIKIFERNQNTQAEETSKDEEKH
jgi:hypothetical protein